MSKDLTIGFLILDEHSGIGGLENTLITICNELEKMNIHSKIMMLQAPLNRSFLDKFEDISLFQFSEPPILPKLPKFLRHQVKKWSFTKQCHHFISQEPVDALIVLNISYFLLRAMPAIQQYKRHFPHVPVIAWPHGSLKAVEPRILEKIKKHKPIFDSYLAISAGIESELQTFFNAENTTLLYNPIEDANEIPTRNSQRFLYIGRVDSPGKRVKELLKLLKKLQGPWHLDIIGGSGSKAGDRDFIDNITRLGLKKHITFHGWQNNPWAIVKETGTLLLHSTSEGFPLVLAEAMKHGIPCLSSNCPTGPNEIIQDGINGWLYEVNDSDQFLKYAQAIIDGTLPLPQKKIIIDSVQKFSKPIVMENFKNAILQAINHKK